MKHILVVHTGGTISMESDTEKTTVDLSTVNPLTQTTKALSLPVHLTVKEPLHKPSPHMTIDDMLVLKKLIESECSNDDIDGVVVTHGTDTMEETAFFLDLTLETEVPVVLTGAMRANNETGSDGLYNLISAIRTAMDEEAKGKGLLVVFNDKIHTAQEVTKVHTTNASAFESTVSGPVGMVTNKTVFFHYQPYLPRKIKIDRINKRVGLIKAYAGMDSSILHALSELDYDGVVIEALGQGNLPPTAMEGVTSLIAKRIPVILVSRCLQGYVQGTYNYYGGGKQLEELGVIFCKGLNGQKARLKLLAALMQTDKMDQLEQYFR